jgi:predicted  nucleic acid-binding Zn-ribbon protein
MEKIKEWSPIISMVLLVLILFRGCGTGSDVNKLKKEVEELNTKVVTQQKMIELIESTVAWKTLRIEEISDKEKISVNALQAKNEKEN